MILKVLEKKSESNKPWDFFPSEKKYFSLIFEKPGNFNFYPGQYLDIKLPVKDKDLQSLRSSDLKQSLPFSDEKRKHGSSRTFTIASSPTEDFLMVTSKISTTPFKKFMGNLRAGDTIITSHPAGTFTLDESSPAVFIAGGIGITPFRSIIKYAADKRLTLKATLIYSNSDNNFLFKKELDSWQKQLPNLEIVYINTSETGRLTTLDNKYLTPNTIYYLAGPPKLVNDFEKILLNLGIDQTNIRYDRFEGY